MAKPGAKQLDKQFNRIAQERFNRSSGICRISREKFPGIADERVARRRRTLEDEMW